VNCIFSWFIRGFATKDFRFISKVLGLYKKCFAACGGGSLYWGCVKSVFMALRAKLSLDRDIFFLILRSKIKKKMSPSKESFAAAGGERLFTQPQIIIWREAPIKTFYTTSCFERQLIFAISRSKIAKMSCLSKEKFFNSINAQNPPPPHPLPRHHKLLLMPCAVICPVAPGTDPLLLE
jgi:hypothetical protein